MHNKIRKPHKSFQLELFLIAKWALSWTFADLFGILYLWHQFNVFSINMQQAFLTKQKKMKTKHEHIWDKWGKNQHIHSNFRQQIESLNASTMNQCFWARFFFISKQNSNIPIWSLLLDDSCQFQSQTKSFNGDETLQNTCSFILCRFIRILFEKHIGPSVFFMVRAPFYVFYFFLTNNIVWFLYIFMLNECGYSDRLTNI